MSATLHSYWWVQHCTHTDECNTALILMSATLHSYWCVQHNRKHQSSDPMYAYTARYKGRPVYQHSLTASWAEPQTCESKDKHHHWTAMQTLLNWIFGSCRVTRLMLDSIIFLSVVCFWKNNHNQWCADKFRVLTLNCEHQSDDCLAVSMATEP